MEQKSEENKKINYKLNQQIKKLKEQIASKDIKIVELTNQNEQLQKQLITN